MSQLALDELAIACAAHRAEAERLRRQVDSFECSKRTFERLIVEADKKEDALKARVQELENESCLHGKYRAQMSAEIAQLKARKQKTRRRG